MKVPDTKPGDPSSDTQRDQTHVPYIHKKKPETLTPHTTYKNTKNHQGEGSVGGPSTHAETWL